MGFFKNLFTDVKGMAQGAADGSASKAELESRLRSLRMLRSSLEFQWRKQEADWKKASSVDENLKKTPLMRAQSMRRAKAIASRMSVVGKLSNMVETLSGVLEQSLQLREHKEQMEKAMGDPAAFKALSEQMDSLMAQNRELVRGISEMQNTFDTFQEQMDSTMVTEAERAETARLNELYEKLETCQASGDKEAERKVQEEIRVIMSGGSTLAFA
jgi:vacuolar-type H+-ATPase subunit D/Vma8